MKISLNYFYYITPIPIRYIQYAYNIPSKNSISDTISHCVAGSMRIKEFA